MDQVQLKQDNQYRFPYHYIPEMELGNFKHYKSWNTALYYSSSTVFIKHKLKQYGVDRLFDVGCGDARLINYLSDDSFFKFLGGFDYSEQAIALAKVLNPTSTLFVKDIYNSATNNEVHQHSPKGFSLVEVFEHIPIDETKRFVEGLSNLMKKGDYLFLTVPHKNVPLNSKHYQHFTANSLSEYFKSDFEIKEKIFFHKIALGEKLIKKILSNKLFVLNARPFRNWLYKKYYSSYLTTIKESKAQRLFFILEKN